MTPPPASAAAEVEVEQRRHGMFGALAAALPERGLRRRAEERPELRVVEPVNRRRRSWQVGTVAGALLFLALFAIAGAQTLIVQQQRHIDDMNTRIAAAQDQAEKLDLDLAELNSQSRILDEAKNKLGMVAASTPVYLQPRADDDARAADVPPATPSTTVPKVTTPTTTRAATTGGAATPPSKSKSTTTPTTAARATTPTTTPSTGTAKSTTPTTSSRTGR